MNVTISLELIESMVDEGTFTGSVLLLEIKEAMELSISGGLESGGTVSLRAAFSEAWAELVLEEPTSMNMSDFEDD